MTANQTVVNSSVMGTWTLFEYDSNGVRKGAAAFGGKVDLIDAQADAAGNWYILGRYYDSLIHCRQLRLYAPTRHPIPTPTIS